MSDGATSPPYPSEATNSRMLYKHLGTLREWVIEQQETLRPLIPERFVERLIDPADLESEAFWENVSVVDKHTVLGWVRRIREGWDVLLRQHEDAWDSKFALQQRFGVVTNATHVIAQAFVDPETREHQNQIAYTKARRQQELIDRHLRNVLVPDELKEEVQQQEEKAIEDDWFASDDNPDQE